MTDKALFWIVVREKDKSPFVVILRSCCIGHAGEEAVRNHCDLPAGKAVEIDCDIQQLLDIGGINDDDIDVRLNSKDVKRVNEQIEAAYRRTLN